MTHAAASGDSAATTRIFRPLPARYRQFVFRSYLFNPATKSLTLTYGLDDALAFTETYRFDFAFASYDPAAVDRACQALFFMAGCSYYKTYVPPEIVVAQGELDPAGAAFFSKTYRRGLGEFWYVNQLDPRTPVQFPATASVLAPLGEKHRVEAGQQPDAPDDAPSPNGGGTLIAIGGGKDSLVSIELLRQRGGATTWSLNHRAQLAPLVARTGLPHMFVEREWDAQLLALNAGGALNGHVPISGIFACVGVLVALLTGQRDVVMSNEQSANDPTLHYDGVAINHQYSKSQEFERDFQRYMTHLLGDRVRYYSFLRPLSEVRISELFARTGFARYKDVFSSCNRAFVHGSDHMSWCGECPKCAFVFLALTPFIDRPELEKLWGGKNLLQEPALVPLYRKLLGIAGDKPLDCVGDVQESRAAMRLAFTQYPELVQQYHFDLPKTYDYRREGGHEMPPESYTVLQAALAQLQQ